MNPKDRKTNSKRWSELPPSELEYSVVELNSVIRNSGGDDRMDETKGLAEFSEARDDSGVKITLSDTMRGTQEAVAGKERQTEIAEYHPKCKKNPPKCTGYPRTSVQSSHECERNPTQPPGKPKRNPTQPPGKSVGNSTQPPGKSVQSPHKPKRNPTQPQHEPVGNSTQPQHEPVGNPTQPSHEPVGNLTQPLHEFEGYSIEPPGKFVRYLVQTPHEFERYSVQPPGEFVKYSDEFIRSCRKGDIIEFKRTLYSHWGIYVGNKNIVHLTWGNEEEETDCAEEVKNIFRFCSSSSPGSVGKINGNIMMQTLKAAAREKKLRVNNTSNSESRLRTRDEVWRDAKLWNGTNVEFSLLEFNCEHFVKMIRYGDEELVNRAKTRAIPEDS